MSEKLGMNGFLRVANKKSQHSVLPVANVMWLQAAGNYTMIYTLDGKENISAYTMGSFFKLLPDVFFRIHKSHVVSLQYIKLVKWHGKRLIVTMADIDNTELVVSRQRRKEFLSRLTRQPDGKGH